MAFVAHAESPEEVAKYYGTDLTKGLSEELVKVNREKYGENKVPPPPSVSILQLILDQFKDLMVLVLLFAVILGFVFAFLETDPEERTTAFIEPWVIVVILVINASIAVYQDINAKKSVDSLKQFQPNNASVIRGGEVKIIPASEVVCGDLVDVSEGRPIPADIRICKLKSAVVKINECILTGEPEPAEKDLNSVAKDALPGDRYCVAYKGTLLERGGFVGIVYAVGPDTQIGFIEKTVSEEKETVTPLQQNLDQFSKYISYGILAICVVTWASNINKFTDIGHGSWMKGALMFFKIAISLAVAAIPEGLPAVVTMTLSLGVSRMAKSNAIVTKLPAVETLGCTSVICSDKTGTLTTNNMVVQVFSTVTDKKAQIWDVTGISYCPDGNLKANGIDADKMYENKAAMKSAMIATLCNDAAIVYDEKKLAYTRKGEPTETAIKVLAEKIGLPEKSLEEERRKKKTLDRIQDVSDYWSKQLPKVRTHEFTRDRKSMSCIVGEDTLVLKGAFEVVLSQCDRYIDGASGEILPLTNEVRNSIDICRQEWSGRKAYRCLGLAYKDAPDYLSWDIVDQEKLKKHEAGCIWAGGLGIQDPERPDVKSSIQDCYRANIRVIMCTGDNKETATAIARNISLLGDTEDVKGKVFTGQEWESMNDKEKREAAKNACVLARVEPKHKRELVGILQEQNNIVAMTGDGVNDAPALSKADIGIAMGTGTTVAQNSAQMILQDDSFSTIVKAVREGRAIYNNTTAFIRYLLTCNIGEVVCCFVSSIIGGPSLFKSTQLLFVNLVTDGLPATALGVNPAEDNVMDLPPRPKDEKIITPVNLLRYLIGGIYLGFATICASYYYLMYDPSGPKASFYDITHFTTNKAFEEYLEKDWIIGSMAMTVLVMVEMFSAITAVSEHQSIFTMPPTRNPKLILSIFGSILTHILVLEVPVLNRIFSVKHLNAHQWMVAISLGFPTLIIEEIFKFFIRKSQKHIHIVHK